VDGGAATGASAERADHRVGPLGHVAGNGLEAVSAAQCQHIRAIAVERLAAPVGNIGPEVLNQVREILADLLEL